MFTLIDVSTTCELASLAFFSNTIFLPEEVESDPCPCNVMTTLYLSGVVEIGSQETVSSLSKPPFKELIEILGTPMGFAGLE